MFISYLDLDTKSALAILHIDHADRLICGQPALQWIGSFVVSQQGSEAVKTGVDKQLLK